MPEKKRVFIGSDHAGFTFKKNLLRSLQEAFPEWDFQDLGTHSEESADYPEFARKVGSHVVTQKAVGILICGSGIGMSISANKVRGVRAAMVWDATSARLSRQHNDANIICLGARLSGPEVALEAAKVWLTTDFLGGRHARRVELIRKIEEAP